MPFSRVSIVFLSILSLLDACSKKSSTDVTDAAPSGDASASVDAASATDASSNSDLTGSDGSLSNPHVINLFTQPSLSGPTVPMVYVPVAGGPDLKDDTFGLVLWQSNPRAGSNGLMLTTAYDASPQTGFAYTGRKVGFNPNNVLTTEAEAFGTTVGAFLNAADIVGPMNNVDDMAPGDGDGKMMITPSYTFSTTTALFTNTTWALEIAHDLQVPTAVDENIDECHTYANMDVLFNDTQHAGVQISYGIGAFRHADVVTAPYFDSSIDQPTQNITFNPVLTADAAAFVTINDATTMQTTTWNTWKHFDYTITAANFQNALVAIGQTKYAKPAFSTDAKDWVLYRVHLNAEMTHNGCKDPSKLQLGWSMRDLRVDWLKP